MEFETIARRATAQGLRAVSNATVTIDGGSPVRARFDRPYSDGLQFATYEPKFTFFDEDAPNITLGSIIVHGDDTYKAATVEPDGLGGIVVTVKRAS